jgi:hypothetical protein
LCFQKLADVPVEERWLDFRCAPSRSVHNRLLDSQQRSDYASFLSTAIAVMTSALAIGVLNAANEAPPPWAYGFAGPASATPRLRQASRRPDEVRRPRLQPRTKA